MNSVKLGGKRKFGKKTSKDPESPEVEIVTEKLSVSVKEHVRRLSGTAEPPPASSSPTSSPPNPVAKGMEQLDVVNVKRDALDEAENKLKDALSELDINKDEVEYLWDHYQDLHKVYAVAIAELMESEIAADKLNDYRGSLTELDAYKLQMHKYNRKVQKVLEPVKKEPERHEGTSINQPESSLRMILPQRELPKFTGDIREWLGFVASFKEIHDDKNLSNSDKFHFLIQSTVDGSPARKLVQSYPFSSDNYTSVFKALDDRFGRKNTLIKVYVRDLLQLVIGASSGQKLEFCDLVTKITSQIRNLESLGVTQDKCSVVLYPVVESCLPMEVLRAWQRSASYDEEDLEKLLEFLQQEVNSQEDRKLAHFELGSSKQDRKDSPAEKVNQFSNTVGTPEVPMQTLVVKLHGTNGKSRNVRVMIDTGSARSYIRSDVADELKLSSVGKESVVHELFGARGTGEITYKKVKAFVSDTSGNDKCMFDCSVIKDIANNVRFPPHGPWLEDFRRREIVFSDAGSRSSKIDVLIGNDIAPKLYTDKKMLLSEGPAAMETRWGWVLGGKLPLNVKRCQRSSFLSTSSRQNQRHQHQQRRRNDGPTGAADRDPNWRMNYAQQWQANHYTPIVFGIPLSKVGGHGGRQLSPFGEWGKFAPGFHQFNYFV